MLKIGETIRVDPEEDALASHLESGKPRDVADAQRMQRSKHQDESARSLSVLEFR